MGFGALVRAPYSFFQRFTNMAQEEIKIFRPTLIEEKPLPLGSEEFAYAPKFRWHPRMG